MWRKQRIKEYQYLTSEQLKTPARKIGFVQQRVDPLGRPARQQDVPRLRRLQGRIRGRRRLDWNGGGDRRHLPDEQHRILRLRVRLMEGSVTRINHQMSI